ncbi:sodium/glutamate symporter [Rubritalea marina]|uniref:sodium/glutamate symporter n=1 Tax=Rubritalea marina TaxID=361055 RepID=UPI000367E9F5|nr:sodium/glutamate symporter [Rubritalea marina]
MEKNLIEVDTFMTYTLAILVFFIGLSLTHRFKILRDYNIPEPVTGGIIASLSSLGLYHLLGIELSYNLEFRDILLVYFFTTIGINARFSDLRSGGRPLFVLLVLTLSFIIIQNIVGVAGARAINLPPAMGVITGSAALIGGHGTAIAWSGEIQDHHQVQGALEIGVAAATLGLVMASLLGGPVSKWLIQKYHLKGPNNLHQKKSKLTVGLTYDNEEKEKITHVSLMHSTLVIHIAIICGYSLNGWINEQGVKLPLFVSCLLVAIALSNSIPFLFKELKWPAHSRAMAVISDFSLGLFIAMSLMGMQLWTLADLAGSLLLLLGIQAIATILFVRFLLFPLMGQGYRAAVLSAGFTGFALGATPTAIANMTAVTKTHGAAPTAFIILPLVGAFFVDLANAFVIRYFLSL